MRGVKAAARRAFPKLSGSVTFHEASLDRVSRRLAFKEETFVWGETQVFETLQPGLQPPAATMGDGPAAPIVAGPRRHCRARVARRIGVVWKG